MDIVIRLRDLRFDSKLTQKQVAELSGVGVKTISSFESGLRIESMKVVQLERIVAVYGISLAEFFTGIYTRNLRRDVETLRSVVSEVAARLNHIDGGDAHAQVTTHSTH